MPRKRKIKKGTPFKDQLSLKDWALFGLRFRRGWHPIELMKAFGFASQRIVYLYAAHWGFKRARSSWKAPGEKQFKFNFDG